MDNKNSNVNKQENIEDVKAANKTTQAEKPKKKKSRMYLVLLFLLVTCLLYTSMQFQKTKKPK